MPIIKNVSDLVVYKSSLELLDKAYDLSCKIPHLKLRTQINNSAEAISPLIAEGFSKGRNPKEAARFYEMAMAESDELLAHFEKTIILSKRYSKLKLPEINYLLDNYRIVSKQLNRLAKIWRGYSETGNRKLETEN